MIFLMIENGYDNQKLNKVYNFCQSIYGDRKRYSGEDYVTHLVNVYENIIKE